MKIKVNIAIQITRNENIYKYDNEIKNHMKMTIRTSQQNNDESQKDYKYVYG